MSLGCWLRNGVELDHLRSGKCDTQHLGSEVHEHCRIVVLGADHGTEAVPIMADPIAHGELATIATAGGWLKGLPGRARVVPVRRDLMLLVCAHWVAPVRHCDSGHRSARRLAAVAERYRLDRGVVTAGKVFGCLSAGARTLC
jgi:hypothetical protein